MPSPKTPSDAVDVLNRAFASDPDAVRGLFGHRVECNPELADDPAIQVGKTRNGFDVGMIGIVNGLFGVDDKGWGYIASVYDVVCATCGPAPGGARVGDNCKTCDNELQLGALTGFALANRS